MVRLTLILMLTLGLIPAVGMAATDQWPGFRGKFASGVSDGQNLPDSWSGETGENIIWKTPVPGLAHASPIAWGEYVYIVTAVDKESGEQYLKHGLYGSGESSDDKTRIHQWKVISIHKKTGKVAWEAVAAEGKPRSGRHVKATQANCTPATDGRFIAAFFGSEGLHVFRMDGSPVWSKDLGRLDIGAYNVRELEWGVATSPVVYQERVILQIDTHEEDYLVAFDVSSGKQVWKTSRDEIPSWGTPTIYPGTNRTEIITNGSNFIRGYDFDSGWELWRLGGSSQITAPTPIFKKDMIVVASGRRPVKPIFVMRGGAKGDITLPEGKTQSEHVIWSSRGRGPYMPTPLIYGDHLYVLNNNGIFDCYLLKSGEEVYRERLPHVGGGFSASPVAADGKIYLPAEDGQIFVVKAGAVFELLATNDMGEILMATPALSDGVLFVRTRSHLFAVGQ